MLDIKFAWSLKNKKLHLPKKNPKTIKTITNQL